MPDLRAAAFRSAPFTVELAGVTLVFPAVSASSWLGALGSGSHVVQVLRLMDDENYERFLDAIDDGSLSTDDLPRIVNKALAEAGGRPWWEVMRLTGAVFEPTGRVLGKLLASGARPETMTLAAFCACVWAAATEGADSTELMKAESRLTVPPPEADLEEFDDTEDFAATARRMQAMPGMRTG